MRIKRKYLEDFKPIEYKEWQLGAEKYLKNITLEELMNVKIEDIELSSFYVKDDVKKIINLSKQEVQSDEYISVNSNGILRYKTSSSLEIAVLFHLLENLEEEENYNIQSIIPQNFFLSISKFRALRYLLSNHSKENNYNFILTAFSSDLNKSVLDEENNLIRATYECLSAMIGTADMIELLPYNQQSGITEFGKRITENIPKILKEESYLDKVTDPLSGSFLIENITDLLIKNIFNHYNKISDYGGIKDEEAIKYIEEEDKKSYNDIVERIENGDLQLVGVNKFQNSNEIMDDIDLKPSDRFAYSFETLKKVVDQNKPRVYIANFTEDKSSIRLIINALNTFNIDFESSTKFELIEDAYNSAKLFNADIIIINANEEDSDDMVRILKNMRIESQISTVNELNDFSMIKIIEKIITFTTDEEKS